LTTISAKCRILSGVQKRLSLTPDIVSGVVRRWKKRAPTFLRRTRILSGVIMSGVQKNSVIMPDIVRRCPASRQGPKKM